MAYISNANTSSNANITIVPASSESVLLARLNYERVGLTVFNASNQICYVAFGYSASIDSYTIPVYPNSFFAIPGEYTGAVSAVWGSFSSNPSGKALVTEY